MKVEWENAGGEGLGGGGKPLRSLGLLAIEGGGEEVRKQSRHAIAGVTEVFATVLRGIIECNCSTGSC